MWHIWKSWLLDYIEIQFIGPTTPRMGCPNFELTQPRVGLAKFITPSRSRRILLWSFKQRLLLCNVEIMQKITFLILYEKVAVALFILRESSYI